VLIVDPPERRVRWLRLQEERYEPVQRSGVIALGKKALAERIDWPKAWWRGAPGCWL
jgi:hypothetical protein